MDKERIYDSLAYYSHTISCNFEELTFLINTTQKLLLDSAQLCRDVGTFDFDMAKARDLFSKIACVYAQVTGLAPDVNQYSDYLRNCGVPMSPANPNFLNPFDTLCDQQDGEEPMESDFK